MNDKKTLRIATRQSPLALWQAQYVAKQLNDFHPQLQIELVPMVTSGDKFLKDKLLIAGGKGLFVKELEEALLANRADLAVHSMKDVPATFPDGLSLAAICQRDSPYDALITCGAKTFNELPKGCKVGTSSLRRQAQLLAKRPDLNIQSLRGNINTRLAKLKEGQFEAIILAEAGLKRMGMNDQIAEILPESLMLPACGQGAIGIECRSNDNRVLEALAVLNDPLTALCVQTERHVNGLLGGNCHVPLAVFCTVPQPDCLLLRAKVLTPNGKSVIEDRQEGEMAKAQLIAERCAQTLLAKGAATLLCENP